MICDKWLHIYGNKLGTEVNCEWVDDVRENVRGEWIFHKSTIEGTDDSRECSVCGVWLNWTMPRNSFCPNCGAQMMRGDK